MGQSHLLESSSSLDKISAKLTMERRKNTSWNKKQRRAYGSILSGIKRYHYRDRAFLFHLTLTTKKTIEWKKLDWYERLKRLSKSWDILVKRIKNELRIKNNEFAYFKVTTKEGGGVIHAIIRLDLFKKWRYAGCYFYFRDLWQEIHGARNVWFRKCFNSKRLAGYVVSQYVAGNAFVRSSHSGNWCFRGFRTLFMKLIKNQIKKRGDKGFSNAMRLWQQILLSDFEGNSGRNTVFCQKLKLRKPMSLLAFRNAYNEQLLRESIVCHLDNTRGQLVFDKSGKAFFVS